MAKAIKKAAKKKPALQKRTIAVLNDKAIIAALKDKTRPVVIISGGCATDFTRQIMTDITKVLATDITRPVKNK